MVIHFITYTVWSDTTPGYFDILYKRVSFYQTEDLSNNAGSSFEPAISAFENNVYVVWRDDTSGNAEILYRRSTDGSNIRKHY